MEDPVWGEKLRREIPGRFFHNYCGKPVNKTDELSQ